MTKNKLLLLLALLMTAATGAWADETYPIVYDFEAAANAGENPANKNGAGGTGQGFYGWESEGKTDWPRQDYKGYDYAEGSVLPKVCHVWRRSDRINGNVSNGGLQCPSDKQMAVDGLTEGLTVTIIYDATNASSKEIVWAIGDGSSSLLTQPRATATINGVEAVPGQTTIKSGDVITVNSVTEAQNGSGYIVFKVMKDMVIKKIIIDEAKAEPAGYTVSMKDGVKDADKWTVKVGEGEAQALPIGGLKGDGSETVTLQYNGRLKVKGVKATSDAQPAAQVDPLAVPMTIEAITAGAIKVSSPKEGMQYSLDGGKTKNAVTSDDIVLNVGDKVQFYGNGTSITCYNGTIITSSGDGFTCKVYGNIMSLVDEENFATATTLSADQTFFSLFSDFITLTDASGLLLPATQLTAYCYYSMFYGCTALTAAPALPATQLAAYCYYSMFKSCARLTAAPELPATQLANNCYHRMFQGCASLTTAPALPATQLAGNCYREMFSICTALTASPVLPAETLVSNCYNQMFYNCSKLATVTCLATSGINQSGSTTRWLQSAGTQAEDTKTIYTVSTADWPTITNNGIPDGWTRVNVDN